MWGSISLRFTPGYNLYLLSTAGRSKLTREQTKASNGYIHNAGPMYKSFRFVMYPMSQIHDSKESIMEILLPGTMDTSRYWAWCEVKYMKWKVWSVLLVVMALGLYRVIQALFVCPLTIYRSSFDITVDTLSWHWSLPSFIVWLEAIVSDTLLSYSESSPKSIKENLFCREPSYKQPFHILNVS